ncbi:MAG: STAS-like domain-containing protein [Agarilytica sp.]
MSILNVGKEFSSHPIGRYYTDGPGSGEEFREEYLLKRLSELGDNDVLEVIIDDEVDGYGSSFLVEAFAGCVKYGHYTSEDLLSKIEIKYSDDEFDFFSKRIIQYVSDAEYSSEKYKTTKS